VVRDDVEEELDPVGVERLGEADEAVLAAELRVDRAVVDDVVAVGRARPRALERRGVDVADPELLEIRGDPFRVPRRSAGRGRAASASTASR
jgi:hypothetical protein